MMQMKEYKEVPQDAPPAAPGVNTTGPEPWMSIPVGSNCPQGLEYLTVLDQLLVSQKIEKLEMITGFETQNRFKVKNSLGQNVYFANEESDCCSRQLCGPARPFEMKIMDSFQNEVLHISRPFRCGLFCFPNCMSMIEVSAPPGQVIGTVEQVCTFLKPTFRVKNSFGDVVFDIVGPACVWKCCSDITMKVLNSANNEQIGKITKQWSGLGRELFTDADYFSVTFPLNLDVRMKALIFAAVFLIDIVYYDH
ncbi:hypothetical protein ACLKA6_016972 [Drosophila palustris]